MKISSLRNLWTPFSPQRPVLPKLVGISLGILSASLLWACRPPLEEPATLTFLDPEWSHDARERSVLSDASLEEFTRQTGIRVKHLPALETSPGQLSLIRDLEKSLVAITGFATGPPSN